MTCTIFARRATVLSVKRHPAENVSDDQGKSVTNYDAYHFRASRGRRARADLRWSHVDRLDHYPVPCGPRTGAVPLCFGICVCDVCAWIPIHPVWDRARAQTP